MRSRAHRWWSTCRTRPRSRTPRCSTSSRPRPATSSTADTAAGVDPSRRPVGRRDRPPGRERLHRAKIAQETLIETSPIPYSIVHATQFFEFVEGIAKASTDGDTVRLAPVLIQPMAADDVAAAVARIAVGPPANGTVEVAGPEPLRLDELVRQALAARDDPREVDRRPRAPATSVPSSTSAPSSPTTGRCLAGPASRTGSASHPSLMIYAGYSRSHMRCVQRNTRRCLGPRRCRGMVRCLWPACAPSKLRARMVTRECYGGDLR